MILLEKNYDVISKRYKNVLEKLEGIEPAENIVLAEAEKGQTIVGIKKEGKVWYLNSRLDPAYAARVYAENHPVRLYGIHFIFGLSDGRHVRTILENCDETNKIIVCEPDMEVFAKVCSAIDISDILEDERVYLYIPKVTETVENILGNVIEYSNAGMVDFCVLPGYDILYRDICESYMDSLIEKIRNALVHKGTYLLFQRMIPRHTLYQMKHMIKQHNLEQLRRALESYDLSKVPAIVISAGPSLDKNVQDLKIAQGKAFIIVVDAALRTVIRAGIRPDMVCTIDPESPDRFFEDMDLEDMNWACIRLTRPWITEMYGKHVFYYGFFEKNWNKRLNQELGYDFPDVPSGGSVSSAAFMISYLLGFKRLILVGQDMAFTGGVSHTKGINEAFGDNDAYIQSRYLMQVEGNDGSMLDTDFQMWYYKQWFEKTIELYEDEFSVINATEGGAKIQGTEVMTLKEAIQQECKGELDVYQIAQEVPPMFTGEKQQQLWEELMKMRESFDDIKVQLERVIEHQKTVLEQVKAGNCKPDEIKQKLKDIMDENEQIQQIPLFDMLVIYAKKEEYEVGDDIYAKADMGIDELIERNLILSQGYLNAIEMFEEDFDEYVIKD